MAQYGVVTFPKPGLLQLAACRGSQGVINGAPWLLYGGGVEDLQTS